jgi:hypothetical protein
MEIRHKHTLLLRIIQFFIFEANFTGTCHLKIMQYMPLLVPISLVDFFSRDSISHTSLFAARLPHYR